jgi:hypothetical protein
LPSQSGRQTCAIIDRALTDALDLIEQDRLDQLWIYDEGSLKTEIVVTTIGSE